MGWSHEGLDDGGQYYYDLAFAVDPNNSNRIHVGGVNHWISEDGGYTFTCPSKWSWAMILKTKNMFMQIFTI